MSVNSSSAELPRTGLCPAATDAHLFVLGTCLEMVGLGALVVGWAPVVGGHGPVHWGHQIAAAVVAIGTTLVSLVLYECHPRLRYWTGQLPRAVAQFWHRAGARSRGTSRDDTHPDAQGWWCWITPWLAPGAAVMAAGRLLTVDSPTGARGWACFAFLIACLAAGSQRRRWLLVRSSAVWSSMALPITIWCQSLLAGAALTLVIGSAAPALALPIGPTTRFLLAMIALQLIFIPLEVLLLVPRRSGRAFLQSLFAGHDAAWFWVGTILVGSVGAGAALWILPPELHWVGAMAALAGTLLLRILWLRPAYE